MVDLDRLAEQARWHAERGRLRAASRALGVVVPLGLFALGAGVSAAPCLAATTALAATAVGLRWWHGDGGAGTSLGLRIGVVPYAVGLAATCLDPASPGWLFACGTACALASAAVLAAALMTGARRGPRVAASGLAVASLTTALGCAEVLLSAP